MAGLPFLLLLQMLTHIKFKFFVIEMSTFLPYLMFLCMAQPPIYLHPVLWSMSSDMWTGRAKCAPVVAPSPSALPNHWRSWRLSKRKEKRRMERRGSCWSSPKLSCCRWAKYQSAALNGLSFLNNGT